MGRPDDWNSPEFVAHYNRVYGMSPEQGLAILEPLGLAAPDRFIDYGCGNGSFLALAAPRVTFAVGIDISSTQVELARRSLAGTAHVQLVEDSFLSFVDSWSLGPSFSKAFSRKSLHHLADEDKAVFCAAAARQLQPGALFLIEDGIFDFDRAQLPDRMPQILREAEVYYGAGWAAKRDDFQRTLDNEFPTGYPQWEDALRRGGFSIARHWQTTCFYGGILAKKER